MMALASSMLDLEEYERGLIEHRSEEPPDHLSVAADGGWDWHSRTGEGGLADLAREYRDELEQGLQEVHRCLSSDFSSKAEEYRTLLADLPQTVSDQKERVVHCLIDLSPMDRHTNIVIVAGFIPVCSMLLAMSICYALTRYLLAPVVSTMMSNFAAFTFAFVVVPTGTFCYIFNRPQESSEALLLASVALLAFPAIEGVLTGALYCERSLSGWAPVPLFGAIAIVVTPVSCFEYIGTDRKRLLGATLGAGLAMHLVWGVIVGFSMAYILLVLLYTLTGYTILQCYIKFLNININDDSLFRISADKSEWGWIHVYQASYVCGILVSDLFVMALLSSSSSKTAEEQAAA